MGHDKKKVVLEVVENHEVEEPTDHEESGLRGFDFNVFDKYEERFLREGSSDFLYLLIVIKLWPGNCISQLKRMIKRNLTLQYIPHLIM